MRKLCPAIVAGVVYRDRLRNIDELPASRVTKEKIAEVRAALTAAAATVSKERSRESADQPRGPIGGILSCYEQRFTRSKGNPLHAWSAIAYCTQYALPLPEWCSKYLNDAANQLLSIWNEVLTSDSYGSPAQISEAFGFSQSGWSAFK